MITVIRPSILGGPVMAWDLNVTEDELIAWCRGLYAQDAFRNLNAEQREFIMTGITPDEWADKIGSASEDDEC